MIDYPGIRTLTSTDVENCNVLKDWLNVRFDVFIHFAPCFLNSNSDNLIMIVIVGVCKCVCVSVSESMCDVCEYVYVCMGVCMYVRV